MSRNQYYAASQELTYVDWISHNIGGWGTFQLLQKNK